MSFSLGPIFNVLLGLGIPRLWASGPGDHWHPWGHPHISLCQPHLSPGYALALTSVIPELWVPGPFNFLKTLIKLTIKPLSPHPSRHVRVWLTLAFWFRHRRTLHCRPLASSYLGFLCVIAVSSLFTQSLLVYSYPAKFHSLVKTPGPAMTHSNPSSPHRFLMPSHATNVTFRGYWPPWLSEASLHTHDLHPASECSASSLKCWDCVVVMGSTRWHQALLVWQLSDVLDPQQGQSGSTVVSPVMVWVNTTLNILHPMLI